MSEPRPIPERLRSFALRRDRFTYDVRGGAFVEIGTVVAFRTDADTTLPEPAIAHALENEGLVSVHKDQQGQTHFTSCKLFMDLNTALRFAREQDQRSVFNLNRQQEMLADARPGSMPDALGADQGLVGAAG
ncbi:MAG TPA: hypothetical protein VGE21_03415 [Flavobacteriales bacterium]